MVVFNIAPDSTSSHQQAQYDKPRFYGPFKQHKEEVLLDVRPGSHAALSRDVNQPMLAKTDFCVMSIIFLQKCNEILVASSYYCPWLRFLFLHTGAIFRQKSGQAFSSLPTGLKDGSEPGMLGYRDDRAAVKLKIVGLGMCFPVPGASRAGVDRDR
ncbi:hypothetical protein RRG08_011168 [Elysia crispata]|uniref:Uncharacterized protein n=1 Tax=Elysia crispata TaxID=231223 RepID=A0AAE1DR17_9GAST|nr:hypothetical protein RRG08_011168 [Elysia crispata]